MKNKHWRCEVCDSLEECSCFCDCWLPHSQCVCDMTLLDWNQYSYHNQIIDILYLKNLPPDDNTDFIRQREEERQESRLWDYDMRLEETYHPENF